MFKKALMALAVTALSSSLVMPLALADDQADILSPAEMADAVVEAESIVSDSKSTGNSVDATLQESISDAMEAVEANAEADIDTFAAPQARAAAKVNVYTTPGKHTVNGRQWNTVCGKYSSTLRRCRAEILTGGKWEFNNLTYLPVRRNNWGDNPLARPGYFTSGGREWMTSCNDEWTGQNGCRAFIKNAGKWVFNNIVTYTPGSANYPKFSLNTDTGEFKATATPTTQLRVTNDTRLYTGSKGTASKGALKKNALLIATSRILGGRSEVFHSGGFYWVNTSATATGENLNRGYSSGLNNARPNTKALVRHVWATWPEITTMYGVAGRGNVSDHPTGRAVDIMLPKWGTTSGKAKGWEMARFYRAHASEFDIKYIIFDQQIWSVGRNREGWRKMEDRGGATANHKDHIHISLN